jgi:hypothetical protein
MIRDYWESFREFLAFKIYPEFNFYVKVANSLGELNENSRIVELIEQSAFKNKNAILDLVAFKFHSLDELKQSLDDAFEDRTSSDAS